MFIDSVVIEVGSGKGGDGWCTCTVKISSAWGPDGGDGGRGGDVVLKVNPLLNTLNKFITTRSSTLKQERTADPVIAPDVQHPIW